MKTTPIIASAIFALSALAAHPALAGGDPITACIGKEGALRVLEVDEPCGPGERKLLLSEWEPEAEEAPDEEDADKAKLEKTVQELSNRVAALESAKPQEPRPDKTEALNVESLTDQVGALSERIAAAEKRLQSIETQFKEKLVVKDLEVTGRIDVRKGGVPVFSVSSDGSDTTVDIRNPQGSAAVVLSSAGAVGYVAVENGDDRSVQMGGDEKEFGVIVTGTDFETGLLASAEWEGLRMSSADGSTIVGGFGRSLTDQATKLQIRDDKGNSIVAIGSDNGGGAVVLRSSGAEEPSVVVTAGASGQGGVFVWDDGAPVAGLDAEQHSIYLAEPSGNVIAALREAKSGNGGAISAFTNNGEFAFSAGAGAEAGDACVYRGEKGVHCLGIGLPLR